MTSENGADADVVSQDVDGSAVGGVNTDAAASMAEEQDAVSAPLLQNGPQSSPDPGNGHDVGIDDQKFVCDCSVDQSLVKGLPPMSLILQVRCSQCFAAAPANVAFPDAWCRIWAWTVVFALKCDAS